MPTEQEVQNVITRLRREGWKDKTTKGSHKKFEKNGKVIIVPLSRKELTIGTYRNVAKQAGWL